MVAVQRQQTRPIYQLQARGHKGGGMELTIWELPSPATPRLREPERVATLKGRPLSVVEVRLLRALRRMGIRLGEIDKGGNRTFDLAEDDALHLGLLFRALAPMRSIERIRMVCEGVEKMSREESAYWLGMAVHRKNPRRVLAALRVLLTMPYT